MPGLERSRPGFDHHPAGTEFRKFTIAGGGKLALDKLNQSSAEIHIAGSGKISANGRIGDLKTKIAGSGDADLDRLTVREAEMKIAGSGNIRANGKIDSLMSTCEPGPAISTSTKWKLATPRLISMAPVPSKPRARSTTSKSRSRARAMPTPGQIQTRRRAEIHGHGDVHIAPSEEAKIEISGSGDVYLHSNPKTLDTQMHGSGRIHKVGPAG